VADPGNKFRNTHGRALKIQLLSLKYLSCYKIYLKWRYVAMNTSVERVYI
jgi:hypothetical protein